MKSGAAPHLSAGGWNDLRCACRAIIHSLRRALRRRKRTDGSDRSCDVDDNLNRCGGGGGSGGGEVTGSRRTGSGNGKENGEDDSGEEDSGEEEEGTRRIGTVFYTSGSYGNPSAVFMQQMTCAMQGRQPPSQRPGRDDLAKWPEYGEACCLWPSRSTAAELYSLGGIINGRGVPASHWHRGMTQKGRNLFHDAVPNPRPPNGFVAPTTHGKFALYDTFPVRGITASWRTNVEVYMYALTKRVRYK